MGAFEIIERCESVVRSYCRSFPTVFDRAQGAFLYDMDGKRYIDFFAGAGALNYGHNNPLLKKKVLEYVERDGIVHGLDMATNAKAEFLKEFKTTILEPRGLDYLVQFPGPTGTNAVEAAIKLARKVTGRSKVVSFTNAFHGMTLGSLALTGNAMKRGGAGVDLTLGLRMPFEGYYEDVSDTIEYMERMISDDGSGIDAPAAVIVETVQAEGGVNPATFEWLLRLEDMAHRNGMLLIVDDIQVGCGRTGPFFSFEPAGIKPDIVLLSKSISGYGLPMALTLIKPEYDQWEPGEHNGTFRGNNLAFITAAETLRRYWRDDELTHEVEAKAELIRVFLNDLAAAHPEINPTVKGRGMIQGIRTDVDGFAVKVCRRAFQYGLVMETAGPADEVFKLLPSLTIDREILREGFAIIEKAVAEVSREEGLALPVGA